MLQFKEYTNEIDLIGKGWHLYSDDNPTSYFFFLAKDSKDFELFYGNGFFIARSQDMGKIKDLTLKIYEKFPSMEFDVDFDIIEFKKIRKFAKDNGFDTYLDLSEFGIV